MTRRAPRAADDGYRNPLVPGLRATADAERLASALAWAHARLEPPGPHPAVAAEPDLELYDMAALDVIVREAGGRFTSLAGHDGPNGGNALASNGLLHDTVLGFLGSVGPDRFDPDHEPGPDPSRDPDGATPSPEPARSNVWDLDARRRPSPPER